MSVATGGAFMELVAVMDRLRSPGGCPWDAEQTHASLATHLLEETYEVLDALDSGDREHLREELGDLLLQVVFHARLAQEHPTDPWSIDDVARGIVDKLVARHPHVFAGASVDGATGVQASWEELKAAEKQRESLLDGIPATLPALAQADKVLSRLGRSGLDVAVQGSVAGSAEASVTGSAAAPAGGSYGARLLALVAEARAAGVDAEADLRRTTSALARRIAAAEAAARTAVEPPAAGASSG